MNLSLLSVTFQLPTGGCSGRDGFTVVITLGIVVVFSFKVVVVFSFKVVVVFSFKVVVVFGVVVGVSTSTTVSACARAANVIRHKY